MTCDPNLSDPSGQVKSAMISSEKDITLPSGLTTSVKLDLPHDACPVMILGHGLGVGNLRKRNHVTDKWIRLASSACLHTNDVGVISYTARGHGDSTGWESTAHSDKAQFTWERLAGDMLEIVDNFSSPSSPSSSFLAGGSSMGSATALFTAIQNPDRVRGLLLMRPPTAWESRAKRKQNLLSVAHKLLSEEEPGEQYHNVLLGAAEADLPPLDSDLYSRIQCPVLILTIAHDDAHPVSTAEGLLGVLANASLHVSEDVETAAQTWPDLISDFVRSITTTIASSSDDIIVPPASTSST